VFVVWGVEMSTSTKENNQHEVSSSFGKVKPLIIFIIGVICSFGLAKWPIKGEVHWLSVMGQTLQLTFRTLDA